MSDRGGRLTPYAYVAPALVVFAAFVLWPLGEGVRLSFTDWDGLTPSQWVGLDNYKAVFTDAVIRSAFLHALTLILFYSLLPIAFGLLLASTLSRRRLRGLSAYRAVLFLPQAVSTIVIGITFRYVYAPDGPLDTALQAIGLGGVTQDWLGDPTWALPAIGLIGTWQMTGVCIVLFLAGVQRIDPELYDASRVDGASPVREFFSITLPQLKPEIGVAAALTFIAALRTFDVIYVTTRGGPGTATAVPSFEIYRRAFTTAEVGLAAAIAVVLAVAIAMGVLLLVRTFERRRDR